MREEVSSITNLSRVDAWLCLAAGGSAAFLGAISGRRAVGLVLGGLGAALVYRGIEGQRASRPGAGISERAKTTEETATVNIQAPPEEVYAFARVPSNAPRYMSFVETVGPEMDGRSRWTAIIRGRRLEWDTEIYEERPGDFFRWRSLENAPIPMEGEFRVAPAPAGRGATARMQLRLPSRGLVTRAAGLFARNKLQEDMRRLKRLIETGETITVKGQPSGRAAKDDEAGASDRERDDYWEPDEARPAGRHSA